jgi:hypothetical protein
VAGTKSNTHWDIPNNENTNAPPDTADTRFLLGYPLLAPIHHTPSDAKFARDVMKDLPAASLPDYDGQDYPVAPPDDDDHADAKRALSYTPSTGASFISGGQFRTYLRGDLDARVADGSVRFQAIDQEFTDDEGNTIPGLTYLRIGTPDAALTDANGEELPRELNPAKDQKAVSGIGFFTDGGVEGWAKKPINLRSNELLTLTAPTFYNTSYGETFIATYELEGEYVELVNSGKALDVEVPHKIVKVDAVYKTDLGWYKHTVDRGREIEFSTSNKGAFGIGASYEMNVGAKFEHTVAAGLETDFSGKVSLSKGFEIEIGETGAVFKHPFGAWTQEDEAELTGNSSVSLSIAGIDTAPMQIAVKAYAAVMYGAVAAQNLAFMAYDAVLAGQADRTLAADQEDNYYGLKTSLDEGMKIYEAALSLSAITCAAGIVLGAVQAAWSAARPHDPTVPDIQVSRQGIFLRYGSNGIEIGPAGVKIVGLMGGVTIGGLSVTHAAPAVNHQPVPPIIPIRPRRLTS